MSNLDYVIKNGVLKEYNNVIVIPYGVREIGNGVFKNTRAREIFIPDTVEIIGEKAFENSAVKEIIIPDSVVEIGSEAFSECENLEKVTFSENLKKIGNDAFGGCEKLKSLTFPDSVETIGDLVFYADSFEYIKLPKNLKVLGEMIIEDMFPVMNIELDKDNENFYIENNILYNKEKTNALFGWGDYVISDGVLKEYRGKEKDVVIPKGVKEIGGSAFYGANVETVTMCDDVESLCSSCFCCATKLKSVIFSDKIKVIPLGILDGCENLEYIRLPKFLEEIEEYAFEEYHSCVWFEIDPENKNFHTKDGVLYDKNNEKIPFE